MILDANPAKHRRFRQDVLSAMEVKEGDNPLAVLEQTLLEGSRRFAGYAEIASKLALTSQELKEGMAALIEQGKAISLTGDLAVHQGFLEETRQVASRILSLFHEQNPISQGLPKGEFKKKMMDGLHIGETKEADLLIRQLTQERLITDKGNLTALSTFQVTYSDEHQKLQKRLAEQYLAYGFQIPEVEEAIAKEKDKNLARQMIEALAAEGILKRITYQYYMHQEHWKEAIKRFLAHMEEHDRITLAEYRDLLETSRKYAVLILEYLDERKVTALVEDARILLTKEGVEHGF